MTKSKATSSVNLRGEMPFLVRRALRLGTRVSLDKGALTTLYNIRNGFHRPPAMFAGYTPTSSNPPQSWKVAEFEVVGNRIYSGNDLVRIGAFNWRVKLYGVRNGEIDPKIHITFQFRGGSDPQPFTLAFQEVLSTEDCLTKVPAIGRTVLTFDQGWRVVRGVRLPKLPNDSSHKLEVMFNDLFYKMPRWRPLRTRGGRIVCSGTSP